MAITGLAQLQYKGSNASGPRFAAWQRDEWKDHPEYFTYQDGSPVSAADLEALNNTPLMQYDRKKNTADFNKANAEYEAHLHDDLFSFSNLAPMIAATLAVPLGGMLAGMSAAGVSGAAEAATSAGIDLGSFGATSIPELAAPSGLVDLSSLAGFTPEAFSAGEVGGGLAGVGGAAAGAGGAGGYSIPALSEEAAGTGLGSAAQQAAGQIAANAAPEFNILPGTGGFGVDSAGNFVNNQGATNAGVNGSQITDAYTPPEFSDQSVLNNMTTPPATIPNLGSGFGLNDALNIGKGITNIIGALNDKNNNQNTANNASSQLQALLDAQKAAQGRQDSYLNQINDAITKANNNGYADSLKNQLAQINVNQGNYQSEIHNQLGQIAGNNAQYQQLMNGQYQQNTANNAAYVNKLNGLSDTQRADDAAYMKQLTGMYMPGTPEANLMEQQMNAKDAASGRNSQYGTRAVDLAGILAQQRGQLMTSQAYQNALNHTTANGLITNQGYLDAMNNKSGTDILNSSAYQNSINNHDQTALLNSQGYQNSLNNKAQTDLMTSQGYQNAVNNSYGNSLLTSPAYANTVNNSSLMSLLTNPAYLQLNQQMVNGQNNQNNSLLGTASQLLTNGSNMWNSLSNLSNINWGSSGTNPWSLSGLFGG